MHHLQFLGPPSTDSPQNSHLRICKISSSFSKKNGCNTHPIIVTNSLQIGLSQHFTNFYPSNIIPFPSRYLCAPDRQCKCFVGIASNLGHQSFLQYEILFPSPNMVNGIHIFCLICHVTHTHNICRSCWCFWTPWKMEYVTHLSVYSMARTGKGHP